MVLHIFNISITFATDGQIRPNNIMGKDNLIIGTARGKLGDVVFYRTGGEQRFRTRVRPANPRTNAQLIQRCIVSTVVKAYSDFITVCDHAFQGYEGKLKNHQRYMRLNIMAFRPVALAQVSRWSPILWNYTMRNYNWASKDDVNTYVNPYILSEGDLPSIDIVMWQEQGSASSIGLPVIRHDKTGSLSNVTYAEFAEMFGVNVGDQLTFIQQRADATTGAVKSTRIARIILMPRNGDIDSPMFGLSSGDEEGQDLTAFDVTEPNKENYGFIKFYSMYGDANQRIMFNLYEDNVSTEIASSAVIVSRFENNMWRRSNCTMSVREKFKKLSNLEAAVASYLKSDTSSLYLNQATTGERQAFELESINKISDETDMYGMTIAESEEKQTRRKK